MYFNCKKYIAWLCFGSILLMLCTGCRKFTLLRNEIQPATPAGVDNLNKTIWEFLSEDNFHASDLTAVGYFGKAIKRAGLEGILDSTENYTVILPNDTAMAVFFRGLGYYDIKDVPTPVLRNFLMDNIFKGRVRAFDLDAGETKRFMTLNGDYIYLGRKVTRTDTYILDINNSELLSTPGIQVRSQNLDFKNGVVHVVDQFTHFALKGTSPDPIDTSAIDVESDTVYVSKDTYVGFGKSERNKNYNVTYLYTKLSSLPEFTRRTFMQFPVSEPSFGDQIGIVKIYLYVSRIDGTSTVNLYEDAYEDWNEDELTASHAPVAGTAPIGSFVARQYRIDRYYNADISAAYAGALSGKHTFINIGIQCIANNVIRFWSKEYMNGDYKSFLVVSSTPKTLLTSAVINNPVAVAADTGYKTLSLDNLKLEGTSDQNIFYIVREVPQHGFLVRYGIPLQVNASFTQEDLAKGGIRYLADGAAGTDRVVLDAKDFQGGYYPDSLTIEFQVQ